MSRIMRAVSRGEIPADSVVCIARTYGGAQLAGRANLVARLLAQRFEVGEPRSVEYQAGTRALLEHRAMGRALVLPYTVGTAQADAWFAGVEDGKALWRRQQGDQA